MTRIRLFVGTLVAIIALATLAFPPQVFAGLGDRLKKKVESKIGEKTDKAVDKAGDAADPSASSGAEPAASAGTAGKGGAASDGGKVSAVSTKFDFIPGDKVLFADDFTQDDLGEFPARWSLKIGTFETAEMDGERWLRLTSNDGTVGLKLPFKGALPEYWTLEFDAYTSETQGYSIIVQAKTADDRTVWQAAYPQGPKSMAFSTGAINAATPFEAADVLTGRRHVMVMARGKGLKVYIDRQRMVNVPEITDAVGVPTNLEIRLWILSAKPMITNVRFAEASPKPKDLMESGKLVTYGIRFATGSDVVQPESAPVLRDVSAYLTANPAVKVQITGHTDNVGTAASNLDLSKRRAASVARVLSDQFAITADRMTTDGKGDTQTVSSNATSEGRAMNRRVEFTKL